MDFGQVERKCSDEQSNEELMEIACEQIRKSYQSRQGSTLVLHNVSFQVVAQEFLLAADSQRNLIHR